MELILQSSLFCSVKTLHGQDLLAETNLIGTAYEATARLVADQQTYTIKDARWQVLRSPGGSLDGGGRVPALRGVTAFLGAGAKLKQAVGDAAGGLARELLADCIKGCIQALSFLYRVRGYKSLKEYSDHWQDFYANSCRYYSNLDRVQRSWAEYVGEAERRGTLFNRSRHAAVYRQPEGLLVLGGFADSHHELGLQLCLDSQATVRQASGQFLRAPDAVCFESPQLLQGLRGLPWPGLSKKEIAGVLGGAQGCVHMVDLAFDLARAAAMALGRG